MRVFVTPSDELPIYPQIMRQVIEAIAAGRLEPGEKLPSHRELGEELVIAPLTVKKAYEELEALGYIEAQRGRGTFVTTSLPRSDTRRRQELLMDLARKLMTQARLAGLDLEGAMALLRMADRELSTGRKGKQSVGR